MKLRYIRNSQGVALLAALFVLMVLSILGIGLLTNVDDELKMSKGAENSERALKIAEAGVQMARASFFNPAVKQVVQTEEISSVDGFYQGGYFLAQLESGIIGAEKWTQWRYDEGVSGHNNISEISTPVFRVWATANTGLNGFLEWAAGQSQYRFFATNLYAIVARGTYFSMEQTNGTTRVRAHDEYTGSQQVTKEDNIGVVFWRDDKTVTNSTLAPNVDTATWMSPMASFSDYSGLGMVEIPLLRSQTLYFTYAGADGGGSSIPATAADTTTTVRLRAANALCNNTANGADLTSLWEFDTGKHGIGTAPVFFDPDPDTPGDEIIYFAVISMGESGIPGAGQMDLNQTGNDTFLNFPNKSTDGAEQIYLYAVVDRTIPDASNLCTPTSTGYTVKWTHPFPDPDVVNWTDYPTEHATGTDGQDPPYVRSPADMTPFMPEEDIMPDYRDGPGYSGQVSYDQQWNQVRGNIAHKAPPACSAPVLSILYEDSSGNLTPDRDRADPTSQFDPRINIYLMYAARSRVVYYAQGTRAAPVFTDTMQWTAGQGGWGPPGYRKPNSVQVRVIALRDRLVRSGSSWNWNAARSRFPEFKWSYRVPAHDPSVANPAAIGPDQRPWNGYGEYIWDTWFMQHVAPMINTVETDQSHREWADITGAGAANLYTVIYSPYRSDGFVTGAGFTNTVSTTSSLYTAGPTVAQGSPVDFSGQAWTDARVMMMAIRDTWEDYMAGNQTNYLYDDMVTQGNSFVTPTRSNPVEPYWVHDHTDHEAKDAVINSPLKGWTNSCETGTAGCPPIPHKYPAFPNNTVITYNMTNNDTAGNTLQAPYPANADKIGFPRPYTWSESLWDANVRDETDTTLLWSMYQQGWQGVNLAPTTNNACEKADIRGESPAMCKECLNADGLIMFPFTEIVQIGGTRMIDLRLHAINATTGEHQWDYHAATDFAAGGDNFNATPAIANNKVFVAYKRPTQRTVMLEVLDAVDGRRKQAPVTVDQFADAIILSPTIANGAVYVGTYDFGTNQPPTTQNDSAARASMGDDVIRLFAMSPVLRLVSTGIYPFDFPGAQYPFGFKHYTGAGFTRITSLNHDIILKDSGDSYIDVQGKVPISKRKIQVWVTGENSKWEEVREVLQR